MNGNRITFLGEPIEATDAVNRNYQHRRLTAEIGILKTEINKSISDLTKTNNEKVNDLETTIMKGTS